MICPGGLQRVPHRKRDLAAALLQQDQVLHRGLGGLHLGPHIGKLVAVDFSDRNPERIIYAGGAAGQHVDKMLGPRRRRRPHRRHGNGGGHQFRTHEY
jgi:hypothetical protein